MAKELGKSGRKWDGERGRDGGGEKGKALRWGGGGVKRAVVAKFKNNK
jgi:hypothetical protein